MLLCLSIAKPASANQQLVTGYLENVKLADTDFEYDAKLDTGADNTSVNAEIISTEKAEDGTPKTVKFKLTDKTGQQKEFTKNVIRIADIKSKIPGQKIERPVVEMEFCIADRLVSGEVNLADRRQFEHKLLIGRNMLVIGNLLVDSEEKYLTSPDCKRPVPEAVEAPQVIEAEPEKPSEPEEKPTESEKK